MKKNIRLQFFKKKNLYSKIGKITYGFAFFTILGGCLATMLYKQTLAELFGVAAFLFLGIGIVVEVVTDMVFNFDQ